MQNTTSNCGYIFKLDIEENYTSLSKYSFSDSKSDSNSDFYLNFNIFFSFSLSNRLLLAGRKYPLLAGLLLFLSACGGMRNVEKDSAKERIVLDRSMSLQSLEQLKSERKTKSLMIEKDSSSGSYRVQIWPKGKFRFTAAQGFEGSADTILMLGTTKQVGETLSKSVVAEQSGQLTTTALQKEGHLDSLEVRKSLKKKVSWKTLLGYALICFSLVACLVLLRSILLAKKLAS